MNENESDRVPNSQPPRPKRPWLYLLLISPLLLVLGGCLLFFISFSLRCIAWRAPSPWPNTAVKVTTEHLSASMITDTTTTTYTIKQPAEAVERYYTEQLQKLCLAGEISPFTTVYDAKSSQSVRQASCLLQGRSMPPSNGTPNQFDTDMTYRAQVYEAMKGVNQTFGVTISPLAPNQQQVVQSDSLSCP